MSKIEGKKLVFRLGEVGFLIDLNSVVEVVEDTSKLLDFECNDISCGIVSSMRYRQVMIPVVDPTLKLNILSPVKLSDKTAIVLHGVEGRWAFLVDLVENIVEASKFNACCLSAMLQHAALGFYSQVKLLNDEPLIVMEPDNYYGATVAA